MSTCQRGGAASSQSNRPRRRAAASISHGRFSAAPVEGHLNLDGGGHETWTEADARPRRWRPRNLDRARPTGLRSIGAGAADCGWRAASSGQVASAVARRVVVSQRWRQASAPLLIRRGVVGQRLHRAREGRRLEAARHTREVGFRQASRKWLTGPTVSRRRRTGSGAALACPRAGHVPLVLVRLRCHLWADRF
jgi:hypothetical protein